MGGQLGSFAESLRRRRLAAGLTQEDLAERAGLSTPGIQDLEGGRRFPRQQTLRRLTAAVLLQEDNPDRLRPIGAAPRR